MLRGIRSRGRGPLRSRPQRGVAGPSSGGRRRRRRGYGASASTATGPGARMSRRVRGAGKRGGRRRMKKHACP